MNILIKTGKTSEPEFSELKRRFGWEFNGMRLHELYFENISKTAAKPGDSSKIYKKIIDEFGSAENFEKDFKATGMMRGIGWVILYFDKNSERIFSSWINEHDSGHLSGCVPLIVMDVFEHAYMIEYGLKKADYINAFFAAIDWEEVERRIKAID